MTTTTALGTTWSTRELPILRAALRRIDAGEMFPSLAVIQEEAGLDGRQLLAGIAALETASPPYLEVKLLSGGGLTNISGRVHGVSERARRELGTWPSAETVVDRMAAAMADAADAEEEPQRKGKLRAGAEALLGFGRDIAVEVIAKQVGG